MSRVERHRQEDVAFALAQILRAVGHPLDTRAQIKDINYALNNLYTQGSEWGAQDGYQEAREIWEGER